MHTERATTASILFKMINSQQRGKKPTRLVKLHGTPGWAGVVYTRGNLTCSPSQGAAGWLPCATGKGGPLWQMGMWKWVSSRFCHIRDFVFWVKWEELLGLTKIPQLCFRWFSGILTFKKLYKLQQKVLNGRKLAFLPLTIAGKGIRCRQGLLVFFFF